VKLKPRVLCIDDDPGIGVLLTRLFEDTGRFHFTFETEPFRAVELARKFRPDLLMLDINMPGQTGIQIATQLRNEPWLRYRPIVLFTGLATREIPTVLQLADSPTEFLAKGVPTRVIVAMIDRLLGGIGTG
jgi:CheY-like chemotaxis protein